MKCFGEAGFEHGEIARRSGPVRIRRWCARRRRSRFDVRADRSWSSLVVEIIDGGRGDGDGRAGQSQCGQRVQQTDTDTDPADQFIAAEREQRCGGEDRHEYGALLRTTRPTHDSRVGGRFAACDQIVVDQRLERPRFQCARDTPDEEAEREADERRLQHPEGETRGLQHAAQDEQSAARHSVGPRARGHLEQERGHRPDRQQQRDLCGTQSVIGEENAVEGIDR